MEQHKNDRKIKDDLTDKAQLQVHLDLVEVQDNNKHFENMEVVVRLGSFNKKVRYSQLSQNNYLFDQGVEM